MNTKIKIPIKNIITFYLIFVSFPIFAQRHRYEPYNGQEM